MPLSKKTKIVVILVVGLVLIAVVLFQSQIASEKFSRSKQQPEIKTQETVVKASVKINYDHKENLYSNIEIKNGQTALDLIQKVATISATGQGEMTYVTAINGRVADTNKKEFWEMWVNDQPSQVGAGSYKVQSHDQFDWKISNY